MSCTVVRVFRYFARFGAGASGADGPQVFARFMRAISPALTPSQPTGAT
jgi:hypothetical protein